MLISTPKLCHLPDGRFYITLPGSGRKRRYFTERGDDPKDPPASVQTEYLVACAELTGQVERVEEIPDNLTVSEIVAKFIQWARDTYPNPKIGDGFQLYTRALVTAYGRLEARRFGGAKLIALRDAEVARRKRSRQGINRMVRTIQRCFGWAVSRELVPPEACLTLDKVETLRKGITKAPEYRAAQAVPFEIMEATLRHCPPMVADMARLQWYTGMRPGEVVSLNLAEIDRSFEEWIYRPAEHKTAWRDKERLVAIGPKGQEIINRYLRADGLPIFSPAKGEAERRAALRETRETPLWPSSLNRPKKVAPRRTPSESYTAHSYRRAIARACDLAKVPRWSPYSLRKAACDRIIENCDMEAARAALGHADRRVTARHYARTDLNRIRQVARVIG